MPPYDAVPPTVGGGGDYNAIPSAGVMREYDGGSAFNDSRTPHPRSPYSDARVFDSSAGTAVPKSPYQGLNNLAPPSVASSSPYNALARLDPPSGATLPHY